MTVENLESGPMGPFPPSGRPIELPFIGLLRVENGKVAEISVEWGNLGPLIQLGHIPPPSGEKGSPAAATEGTEVSGVLTPAGPPSAPPARTHVSYLAAASRALGDTTSYTFGVPPSATAPPLPEGLADVLDALPIGLYVVDRDLRVVAWNRLREKGRYGLTRQQAVAQPLRRVLGAAGFRATEPVLASVFRTGKPHEETVESGETLYHVRRLPVRRGRRTTHVLSWFEDITERRALEMRLIAADRFAFLGQLVSGVAHEISNPLAGIAGCAEALAELAAKGGRAQAREARQFRNLIRAEVARSEQIVRFLLDSSRPSSNVRADLAETVSLALRLLERHPAFARIRVRATVPNGLPAGRIDADSLKQVVMALAVNASQAMPSGGTLSVRAAREGRTLLLDVTDTGAPVPVAQRAQLFEPFATSADAQRGAGLGLAVARSLLRSRGGDLAYRPRKGGNAYRVVLRMASGKA